MATKCHFRMSVTAPVLNIYLNLCIPNPFMHLYGAFVLMCVEDSYPAGDFWLKISRTIMPNSSRQRGSSPDGHLF